MDGGRSRSSGDVLAMSTGRGIRRVGLRVSLWWFARVVSEERSSMRSKLFSSTIPGRSVENTSRPVGRIWPNGEFSLGYVPELEEVDQYKDAYLHGRAQEMEGDALDEYLQGLDLWEDEVWSADSLHGQPCEGSLTLSNALNSHKPPERAKYGLKGLTARGRKMIRSGAFLLEDKLGKDDVVMVTLTVPTLSREGRLAVAKQWGVLVNRLVQYLSRTLLSQGRPAAIVGCVEVQTGRLKKYRQGYLHLHLVAPAHSNKGRFWAIEAGELRAWWQAALERVIGSTLPHMPRIETAIVETSVEAYLAKYLSKGEGDEMAAFIEDLGEDAVPGQWWFCSAPMREKIEQETVSGANCGALLESTIEHLLEQGTGEGFEYIRHVERPVGRALVTCGWVGKLTPELRAELRLMLSPF